MIRFRTALLSGVTLTLLAAGTLPAQGTPPVQSSQGGGGGQRAQLEQRLRQRIAAVVKQRLQLTDSQLRQLAETNRKYDQRRRELVQQERAARAGLRAEILAGDGANQQHVSDLLEQLIALQRQRLDVLAQEQHDLSAFLTPVQRAKYVAIEEQMRRRVEQMRQRELRRGRRRRGQGQPLR